jgi:acyl carrier protein
MRRDEKRIRDTIRAYLANNFLLDSNWQLDDSDSLLDAGVLDSTGAMELVAFLGDAFSIDIADEDITADNLDSVDRICCFLVRKATDRRAA